MVLEVLSLLAPGALTFLTAKALAKRERVPSLQALMEWVLYSVLDLGLFWLLANRGASQEEETVLTLPSFSDGTLWGALLLALLVGLVLSFLVQMNIHTAFVREGPGLLERMSPRGRSLLRGCLTILAMGAILGLILQPELSNRRQAAQEADYKKAVLETFQETQKALASALEAGQAPEDLADIQINGMTVRRVDQDMRWKNGSGKREPEAVYMADGNGDMVYFSYQDSKRSSTWSGPSKDADFLSKNGGWNSGMGYGWSGFSLK